MNRLAVAGMRGRHASGVRCASQSEDTPSDEGCTPRGWPPGGWSAADGTGAGESGAGRTAVRGRASPRWCPVVLAEVWVGFADDHRAVGLKVLLLALCVLMAAMLEGAPPW